MEKKDYECPMTEIVLVQVGNNLLEDSPIGPRDPDGDPDSRERRFIWNDEE